jgi:hypothetical protein
MHTCVLLNTSSITCTSTTSTIESALDTTVVLMHVCVLLNTSSTTSTIESACDDDSAAHHVCMLSNAL